MISKEEVEYVAWLAHIELTDEEKEKFIKELCSIIEFVQKLNEIQTEEVQPMYHIAPIKNITREDKVEKSLAQEKVLEIAPAKERCHYKVPKIIV